MAPASVSEGCVLVALKCYFDGSQKHGRRLTIAAIAGDEAAWRDLEHDWLAFLASQGLSYMHMKEAIARKGEFQGWKKDKRDWFINGLITFFNINRDQHPGRLKAITSSVDLKAHAEFAHIPGLPSPARMCVRGLAAKIFKWYSDFPDTILDVMDFYFDRDEPFLNQIDEDWKSPVYRARHPWFGMIRTMAQVDMRLTPGIQVADLFAWSRTHVDRGRSKDRFLGSALSLCHPSMADHWVFDREKIRTYPRYAIM
jgi:hypothetical protein